MRISKLVLIVLFLSSAAAYAQQSETRSVGSFEGVKAAEAIDVYLKKGDKESVKVEVTGIELSSVLTEVAGTTLKIHMRDNSRNKRTVKVYVTYVKLDKISASSAANVFSDGVIKASRMEISVSSAGSTEIKIESDAVAMNASSAGKIVLEGKAGSLDIDASSAGGIDAYNLESENVEVSVSSGGSAKINVTKSLVAHASSGGDIRYRGNPSKTNTNSSSGGSVKKTN